MTILLDIDGVMVSAKPWSPPPRRPDGFYDFRQAAVIALNQIIASSGADILLTTSHRHSFTLNDWKTLFADRNITVNKISRLPQYEERLTRREEILKWYDMKNAHNFVIIDDDKSLHDLPSELKSKWIQTQPFIGLTQALASESIAVLGTSRVPV